MACQLIKKIGKSDILIWAYKDYLIPLINIPATREVSPSGLPTVAIFFCKLDKSACKYIQNLFHDLLMDLNLQFGKYCYTAFKRQTPSTITTHRRVQNVLFLHSCLKLPLAEHFNKFCSKIERLPAVYWIRSLLRVEVHLSVFGGLVGQVWQSLSAFVLTFWHSLSAFVLTFWHSLSALVLTWSDLVWPEDVYLIVGGTEWTGSVFITSWKKPRSKIQDCQCSINP